MTTKPVYLLVNVEGNTHTLAIDSQPQDFALARYESYEFEDENAARAFAFEYARDHLVHGGDLSVVDNEFFRMTFTPTAASIAAARAATDRMVKMNPLPGALPMPPRRDLH